VSAVGGVAKAQPTEHPDLAGAGWRNPLNPSEAFGEAFDFWCPSATGGKDYTTASPSESTNTVDSQATTPLQEDGPEEWAEKAPFEPSLFEGIAPDAFFQDLAASLANDESELVPAPAVEAPAPAQPPAPQAFACHQAAPLAAFVPAACDVQMEMAPAQPQAPAMCITQDPVQAFDLAYSQELLFPAPHPVSEARGAPFVPVPKMAPTPQPAAVKSEGGAFEGDGGKLCKWKRRDIAKHLAGERSRRAKRMGKVHTLQALVEGLPNKPTVNQILAAAIAQIKQVKADSARPGPTAGAGAGAGKAAAGETGNVSYREGFRCSSFAQTLVLDENHCVVEASSAMLQALQWPGTEATIKGQYIASVMHPEDACALASEAQNFRASGLGESSVQAVRTVASFMGFVPMPGMGENGSCLAFPRGYLPQAVIDVTITNKMMFVNVP